MAVYSRPPTLKIISFLILKSKMKFLPSFGIAAVQGSAVGRGAVNVGRALDPNCPDLGLGQSCLSVCESELFDCMNDCEDSNDSACQSQCNRIYVECNANCPCSTNCPKGCDDCEYSLCKRSGTIYNSSFQLFQIKSLIENADKSSF